MRIAKILATSIISLTLLAGCTVGKGIVSVNGEGISRAEYNETYKTVMKNPQFKMFGDAKDPNSLVALMTRDKVINELIIKKLLDQEAQKRGIKVTPEDLKAQREKIVTAIGGEDRLKELMEQGNISEKQFNSDMANEVKVNKIIEEVADVKVSDAEVKDFYTKNKAQFNFPERVRASHILISANPEEIKETIIAEDKGGKLDAKQIEEKVKAELSNRMVKAKEVLAEVKKDPSQFAELAKKHSEDKGSAVRGGDLNFFARDKMVQPFADASFGMKPGTVSEIVVTQFGYHIILVTDRAKAGLQPLDKVAPEIRAYLEQNKKVVALQKLFDGLKAEAKITYNDPSFDPAVIQTKVQEKAKAQMQAEKEAGFNLPAPKGITPEPEKK